MKDKLRAVAFVIAFSAFLFGVELAVNRTCNPAPRYDTRQSGFSPSAGEGEGFGGGNVVGFQSMPDWWWQLYNWMRNGVLGAFGGGGGGGF